ncbi:MAG TPA: AMP-binding protein [Candidatus Binatia bacterium]|nr:AMP-binding protein [Candidatus Binatia bacterium]
MIYRVLRRQAESHPGKIAITGERRSLSYAQLLKEVEACAVFLQHLHLKAEDPILLGIPPSLEFYIVFYAACAIGATVIPLLPSGKIPPHIREVRPLLAVGDRSFLNAVERDYPSLRGTVVWDRKIGLHMSDASRPFKRKRLIRKERVIAALSSGTTGIPSLHYRSAEVLLDRADLRIKLSAITAKDVLLSCRPINTSSFSTHVIVPIVTGCKVVVQERFQRFHAADAITKERVTFLSVVPLIIEQLASIPVSYRVDFSSLRLCISGGAPLPRYVYDRFYERFGIRIRQRYGGRHISPAGAYNLSDIPEAIGQVSGPFPMIVLSEEGRELGPGEIGEIAFDYSKMVARWKKHLKHNPNRLGKYIYTGDLGKTDATGNVYIVGRKSRFIKVGGNGVAPAEVENVLRSHPLVREALVFPLRLGQSDEAVGAIVVPGDGLTSAELLKYCARYLDGYKCPRRIEFRNSLRRNPQGKVIRHLFESGRV